MKLMRLGLALTASAFALAASAGCRGVIGIEELDVKTDGGTTSNADAGADSGTDSSVLDSSTADGAVQNKCTGESDCPKCCHDDTELRMGFNMLAQLAKASGCICGSGPCGGTTQCGNDICAGNQNPPAMGCLPCVDGEIRPASGRPECATAKTQCNGNSTCKAFLDCITSCK